MRPRRLKAYHESVILKQLLSLSGKTTFATAVAVSSVITVYAGVAQHDTRSGQNSGDTVVSRLDQPELAPLRHCIELDDARCADSALARLRHRAVAATGDYLDLEAQTFALEHRETEALKVIETAVERNPSQPQYLITQGRIYLRLGDAIQAIQTFLKAAKLKPDSPEPLYFLGTSFFLIGEHLHSPEYYDRAERHFQLALEISPDYDRAEFMLGVVEAMQSRFDNANAHLQRAIQLNASNPYYHLHYGILLKHEGRNLEALAEMKIAGRLNSSYALTHFEIGTVYQKLANYEKARKELETAVTLNPNLSIAYYHLGAVYSRLGHSEQSKAAYESFKRTKGLPAKENVDPAATAVSLDSEAPVEISKPVK